MSQKRFTNYKAPVESFPLGEQHIGVFKPGRYNGFDVMETEDNITLTFRHSGRITKSTPQQDSVINFGVFITPTGTLIHQESDVVLNLPTTPEPQPSDSAIRKFILIAEHNYQPVKGGVEATYFIIPSEEFGEIEPELPEPIKQVVLGVITKDHNKGTLTYQKKVAGILGDKTPKELYDIIKEYISIPEPTELPDIQGMITNMIKQNKPRTIITGKEDIGDGSNIGTWHTIPRDFYVSMEPGHDIEHQIVKYRRTRLGDGSDYIDIEIINTGVPSTKPTFTWDDVNVIHVGYVNMKDKALPLLIPQEIREADITGSSGAGSVKRFYVAETKGRVQEASLKVVIQLKNVFEPSNKNVTYPENIVM